jgi:hypothetical protein
MPAGQRFFSTSNAIISLACEARCISCMCFVKCFLLLRLTISRQEELGGRGMRHAWGRGELYTGFWWGNARERRTMCRWRILLKWVCKKLVCGTWTGITWLRILTSRGLLCTRQWTLRFHVGWGISWLTEEVPGDNPIAVNTLYYYYY